jgi:hypothetical protein
VKDPITNEAKLLKEKCEIYEQIIVNKNKEIEKLNLDIKLKDQ